MTLHPSSVIHKLHSDGTAAQASGRENLGSWGFSDGNSLPDCKVWVDARKVGDRIIAIIQPMNRNCDLHSG